MKLVANILQKLGISQRNLANFINANHATLSRYEAATRSLPTDATLQLALMQQLVNTLPTPLTATPSNTDLVAMQQKAKYCLAQCYALQKQLTEVVTHYEQAQMLLQFITAYKLANPILTEKKLRWLDEQAFQANKKIEQYGWAAQHQLQHKIEMLQYEAGLLAPAP